MSPPNDQLGTNLQTALPAVPVALMINPATITDATIAREGARSSMAKFNRAAKEDRAVGNEKGARPIGEYRTGRNSPVIKTFGSISFPTVFSPLSRFKQLKRHGMIMTGISLTRKQMRQVCIVSDDLSHLVEEGELERMKEQITLLETAILGSKLVVAPQISLLILHF